MPEIVAIIKSLFVFSFTWQRKKGKNQEVLVVQKLTLSSEMVFLIHTYEIYDVGIAQLVERCLAKAKVAGSNPVSHSSFRQGFSWHAIQNDGYKININRAYRKLSAEVAIT
jgi:hypothetical protein